MKLTKNVSAEELFCKCTYKDCDYKRTMMSHEELAETIQLAVNHFSEVYNDKITVTINCANRCPKHNHDVGGENNSFHMLAMAADIALYTSNKGRVPCGLVADFYDKKFPSSHGIGRYNTFTHIDIRKDKSRWNKCT